MRIFRFCFVVIVLASIMIYTVYLRSNGRRVFYECRSSSVSINKLKCDLIIKQLEAGSLVNSIVSDDEIENDKQP